MTFWRGLLLGLALGVCLLGPVVWGLATWAAVLVGDWVERRGRP